MDHDGDNDILFTQNGLLAYGILKNDGSENFAFQDHSYELAEPEEVASSIALDIDNDNDSDILQADGDSVKSRHSFK